MLIALEWIRARLRELSAALLDLLERVTLPAVRGFLASPWYHLLAAAAAALLLCFLGYFCFRLVCGAAGGTFFGLLGWFLGGLIGRGYLSIRIILALWLGILGFFLLYVVYQLGLLAGGFLLAWAACRALWPALPAGGAAAAALGAAAVWCVLFVRHKMVLSCLTGAVLLALLLPGAAAAAALAVLAAGLALQARLVHRSKTNRLKTQEEYRKKYIDCPSSKQSQLALLKQDRSAP